MSGIEIVSVVGNPRAGSRTHQVAVTLAAELASALGVSSPAAIELAAFGPRVLDPNDADVGAAIERVLAADVLVLASPTYKATYSGLLKAFFDRIGTGALFGAVAVPVLLGGAPNHQLAVDVHLTPLALELGASVPARGLFVLESELDSFPTTAREWVARHRIALSVAVGGGQST